MISYPAPAFAAADLPELLGPVVEEYREAARRERRLPDELIDRLRTVGAFRLSTPRELGGHELPLAGTLDVVQRLARLDATVAWMVCIYNFGFAAAFMDESAVKRIWSAGPDPLIAANPRPGRLRISEDGYVLSGEWKLVSGIDAADWVMLLGALDAPAAADDPGEGGRELRICWVPRDAVSVRDTWHGFGMRGTNSNTVVIDELPVPPEMTSPFDSKSRIDRPLYRIPTPHIVLATLGAVVLGAAQSAVDELAELASGKQGPDGGPLTREPRFQALIGRSIARLGAAGGYLRETAGELDRLAAAREEATEAEGGAVRGAMCLAAETARDVLAATFEAGGSSPIYASSRLGQIFVDGTVAVQHAALAASYYELAGRTALGLPANATPDPVR